MDQHHNQKDEKEGKKVLSRETKSWKAGTRSYLCAQSKLMASTNKLVGENGKMPTQKHEIYEYVQ